MKRIILTICLVLGLTSLAFGLDITITIPVEIEKKVIDAFAAQGGYQATIDDVANPQSKEEFMKSRLLIHVKDVYRSYLEQAVIKATRDEWKSINDAEVANITGTVAVKP